MKSQKQRTISAIVHDGIMSGKSPEAIRASVIRVYPKSAWKADDAPARVSWFRAKMRAEGIKVPEVKKSAKSTRLAAPKRRTQEAAEGRVA